MDRGRYADLVAIFTMIEASANGYDFERYQSETIVAKIKGVARDFGKQIN